MLRQPQLLSRNSHNNNSNFRKQSPATPRGLFLFPPMKRSDCFYLGKIVKTLGLKGQVVALFDTDNVDRYKNLQTVFIDISNDLVPFSVKNISFKKLSASLALENIDHIDKAKGLVNAQLYLPLKELPPVSGNDFYFHEIINYKVFDNFYSC